MVNARQEEAEASTAATAVANGNGHVATTNGRHEQREKIAA
jgi:hypothetical protein